jgi:hypothetical protein
MLGKLMNGNLVLVIVASNGVACSQCGSNIKKGQSYTRLNSKPCCMKCRPFIVDVDKQVTSPTLKAIKIPHKHLRVTIYHRAFKA